MCGLALASKHSGLLLLPTLALLMVVEIACRVASTVHDSSLRRQRLSRELKDWTKRLAAIYGIACGALWAFYGFRYEARPDGLPLWVSVAAYAKELPGHLSAALVNTAAEFHLLPESYLFGLTDVLLVTHGPRVSFLLGRLYPHALWYYFPIDFVIKSTLGFLALLILGLAAVKSWRGEHCRKAAYILIPPVFFMGSRPDGGHQHGHPAHPAGLPFSDSGGGRRSVGTGSAAAVHGPSLCGPARIPRRVFTPHAPRLSGLLQRTLWRNVENVSAASQIPTSIGDRACARPHSTWSAVA